MTRLPPRQDGPHVWTGDQLRDPTRWTWQLSPAEIDELLAASAPYDDAELASVAAIDRAAFPLPTLAPALDALRRRLTRGRGFELITGFPAGEVSEARAAAVFAGLGAHLGVARSQNAAGDLIGHVRDVGADASDVDVRIYQTNERQTFHTDSCDVVGLLCLRQAVAGGDSLLASVGAIYNRMLDEDPQLVRALFEPIATDRRGETPAGALPYFTIPVLNWYDDALTVMYQRQYVESAQRFDTAPRLSAETVAALDLFDAIANDPAVHLTMRLAVGDIQFVHNHSLLHDRTGFTDDPAAPRHLLRLWLTVPGDRRLPPVFAQRFGGTTVGDRGGIVTTAP